MRILTLFFLLFIITPTFAQDDMNDPELGSNTIDGAIVESEYRFDLGYVILKNNKNVYTIQSNKKTNIMGITGLNFPIGQHHYNQLIIDPNYDSFIYLDSKSMTAVSSVIPVQHSKEKVEMNLIPSEEIVIGGKKCILVQFENKDFRYHLWLTQEDDQSLVQAVFDNLATILNVEQQGNMGSLKITNQVWMKIKVENLKTKETTTYELTQYYKPMDESIMTFDYEFITPKWD